MALTLTGPSTPMIARSEQRATAHKQDDEHDSQNEQRSFHDGPSLSEAGD